MAASHSSASKVFSFFPSLAVFAFNAGETILEDAAIKIAIDHLFHISTEETVLEKRQGHACDPAL